MIFMIIRLMLEIEISYDRLKLMTLCNGIGDNGALAKANKYIQITK